MTDRWSDLEQMAIAALRKNQPRSFQLRWADAIEIPSWAESEYMMAASPALILKLIAAARRVDQDALR